MNTPPAKDAQTVTPDGKSVHPQIEGAWVRPAITHPDDRGTLCEIYSPAWGCDTAPLVYAYQVTIRPGKIKGWVVHQKQDDRLFFSFGTVRVVLFDARKNSTTHGLVSEQFFSDHNRGLLYIPRGVYHAVQNVGNVDALFINHPTRPYDHADPDKFRLPLVNDLIPYRFPA